MKLRIAQVTHAFGAFLILGLLALGGVSLFALEHVRIGGAAYNEIEGGKDLTADLLPPPLFLVEAHLMVQEIEADPTILPQARKSLAEMHKSYEERLAFWRTQPVEPEIKAILTGASAKAADQFWAELEQSYIPAIAAGDRAAAAAAAIAIDHAYAAQHAAIIDMVPLLNAEGQRIEAVSAREVAFNRALLLGVGVLIGALSLVALQLLRRRVVTPVEAISAYMGKLAAGDYHAAVPYIERADELGDMARSVEVFRQAAVERISAREEQEALRSAAEQERERNEADRRAQEAERVQVVESLAEALERVAAGSLVTRLSDPFPAEYERLRHDFNDAVAALDGLISGIGAATSSVDSGSTEIAGAADDLARRTEQQAASLEETAAALDELTTTVGQTAAGANEARQFVASARAGAQRSSEVVAQTVTAMGQIAQSSGQISQIIGVIDEIAFQTNLLALNAGVEAARAGDAGRGFAVVASEVRALAQRSAEAAKEIKGLIVTSSKHVKDGVDLVGETGKALGAIVDQVARIDDLVQGIAAAAHEQSTGLVEINTAVNRMDQMTQQNAAMVEQTTAAAHAMRGNAGELSSQTQAFQTTGLAQVPARAAVPPQVRLASTTPQRRMAQSQPRSIGATALKYDPAADGDVWEDF
jgi:methyl-accepting chemotaxis protein